MLVTTPGPSFAADDRVTHVADRAWQASDFYDPANPGCSIGTDAAPGGRLVMGASRQRPAPMSLVVRKAGWTMPSGTRMTVRATFSDKTRMDLTGRGNGEAIAIDIGNGQLGAWTHNLVVNHNLELTFGEGEPPWNVELSGADRVVKAMGDCLAGHGIVGVGPPFGNAAAVRAPDLFSKHPVPATYRGRPVMPDFAGRDRAFRDYRTMIRQGVQQGADFAGRFKVIEIGCGTDCRFDYVADVSTGQVHAFPRTSGDMQMLHLEYSISSNLIRASWIPDLLSFETCKWENLLFTGGKFVSLGPPIPGTCPVYE